ncbi:MAG: cation transporter [Chitinispirillaceae bacterium]|nr:cation transporter [Chitinispirillaceae bacterium]
MEICPLEPSGTSGHKKRQQMAEFVVTIGLVFNAFLAAIKLTAGIVGNSQALLADGVNSVSDVVYFLVVKFFVRLSGKPADSDHPYGHYQYETIAALVVGAFVITTGLAIFWDSVNTVFNLFTGKEADTVIRSFTLYAALGTIAIKILLMLQAQRTGHQTRNLAVIAVARDHRNDIFASTGVATGILLSMFGIRWADPVAGALVAIVVTKTGFDILREAANDLMDSVPGDELSKQIREALADEKSIEQVEEVHAHRFGPYLVANITICINGSLTVSQADVIATNAEARLLQQIDMLRKVYVHTHPADRCTLDQHRNPGIN